MAAVSPDIKAAGKDKGRNEEVTYSCFVCLPFKSKINDT
jgi:hypothetical protein